jgi:diguanylate cyclase (GGDEF)-like protein/PAS domain S-box-containing protein
MADSLPAGGTALPAADLDEPLRFWRHTLQIHAFIGAALLTIIVAALIDVRRAGTVLRNAHTSTTYAHELSFETIRLIVAEREYLTTPSQQSRREYNSALSSLRADVNKLGEAVDSLPRARALFGDTLQSFEGWIHASTSLVGRRAYHPELTPTSSQARAEFAQFYAFRQSLGRFTGEIAADYGQAYDRSATLFIAVIAVGIAAAALLILDIVLTTARARRSIRTQHARLSKYVDELQRTRIAAERLATEKELILETVDSGIIAVDPRGAIVYTNRAAARLFGIVDRSILDGVQVNDFLAVSKKTPILAALEQQHAVRDVELVLPRIDKTVIVSAAPMVDSVGDVSGAVANITDITARKQMEERLRYLSRHDAQTGLVNRTYLLERLAEAVAAASSSHTFCGVIAIEIEDVKQLTYILGHTVGDALLHAIVERLIQLCDDPEDAARLGTGQFVVLRRARYTAEIHEFVNRVIHELRSPFEIAGRALFILPIAGISIAPNDDTRAEHLLRYADSALQHARWLGSRSAVHYTAEVLQGAVRRITLESDLRAAISEDKISIVYQPIVLANGHVTGLEALARWEHPHYGAVSPDVFISLSESGGSIAELGEKLLLRALREAAPHLIPRPDVTLAVNVSAMQLHDSLFMSHVDAALTASRFPPRQLIFEVTETAFALDLAAAASNLNAARKRGIRVAIDDFGTGYGSFMYLRDFSPDIIKLDAQFIQKGPLHRESDAICRAVVALGRRLNAEIIAEGIEEPFHADYALSLGCDALQGFLFGHPSFDALVNLGRRP